MLKFEIEKSGLNFHFKDGGKADKPGEGLHFCGQTASQNDYGIKKNSDCVYTRPEYLI